MDIVQCWKRLKHFYGDNSLHFSWHSPYVELFTAKPVFRCWAKYSSSCALQRSPICHQSVSHWNWLILSVHHVYQRWQHLESCISHLTPNPAALIFAVLLIILALIRQYCQVEFIWSESLELLLFLALPYFTCGLYSRSWLTGQLIYTRDVFSPIFQERFNGRYFNEAWFN